MRTHGTVSGAFTKWSKSHITKTSSGTRIRRSYLQKRGASDHALARGDGVANSVEGGLVCEAVLLAGPPLNVSCHHLAVVTFPDLLDRVPRRVARRKSKDRVRDEGSLGLELVLRGAQRAMHGADFVVPFVPDGKRPPPALEVPLLIVGLRPMSGVDRTAQCGSIDSLSVSQAITSGFHLGWRALGAGPALTASLAGCPGPSSARARPTAACTVAT